MRNDTNAGTAVLPYAKHHSTGACAAAAVSRDVELLVRYRSYFRASPVGSATELKTAMALRYQVYCLERRFVDATQFPDGLESDALDNQSVQGLLLDRLSNEAIGTVRLILPGQERLPIHSMLWRQNINPIFHFPDDKCAEVSRFALSRQFLRQIREAPSCVESRPSSYSGLPRLGLVQVLLQITVDQGVTHWAAMMQPSLLRMLAAMGIHFKPIGPLVAYHGMRQPCVCDVAQMLKRLFREKPDNWQVVTDGGRLSRTSAFGGPTGPTAPSVPISDISFVGIGGENMQSMAKLPDDK